MIKVIKAMQSVIISLFEEIESLKESEENLQDRIVSQQDKIQELIWEKDKLIENQDHQQEADSLHYKEFRDLEVKNRELRRNLEFYELEPLTQEERIQQIFNDEEKMKEIRALSKNRKVQAIKTLRDYSKAGLKASKLAIDSLIESEAIGDLPF